jgi:hypothetical protein
MAKHDPLSFDFGYNIRLKAKKPKAKKGTGSKSNAWRAYVGESKKRK